MKFSWRRGRVTGCTIGATRTVARAGAGLHEHLIELSNEILDFPRGANGFGYDPLFYYPPARKTFAEMTLEEKARVSHRGRALLDLRREFSKVILWIMQRQEEEDIRRGKHEICQGGH